ncbi:MAG: nitroreductase family protein [Eubacteriales bacterium]|nr:nitroreductase family protein [Eubacteriales bacterium]
MNTLQAIYTRHTTHKYNGKAPSEEQLQTLLKAARASAIGGGKFDTMHITVIRNAEFLQAWEESAAAQIGRPGIHPLYGAPVLILISGILSGTPADNPVYSNGACMVENMTLASTELGLGATHIWGIVNALNADPELKAKLAIPEGFTPICGMASGYTDEVFEEREIPEDKITTVFFD